MTHPKVDLHAPQEYIAVPHFPDSKSSLFYLASPSQHVCLQYLWIQHVHHHHDPSEYEGGDFELDRQYPQPEGFRTKGSVFLFPSFLPHRVTPVTKGVRRSLVSWIEGPKFR